MRVRRLFASISFLGCAFAAQGAPPPVPEAPPPPAAPAPAAPAVMKRAWVGVWFGDAVDGGVQIVEVVPDGPASKAGIVAGDLLIRIDGADVAARGDVNRALAGRTPGDAMKVTVLRGGEARETRVVLGTAPPRPDWAVPAVTVSPVAPVSPLAPLSPVDVRVSDLLGIGIGQIPAELRQHYGGPADAGVLVTRVEPKGAARSALQVGDLLVAVGNKRIAEEDDLDDALTRASSGPLKVSGVRAQKPFTAELDLVVQSPEQRARDRRKREVETAIDQLEKRLADLKRELEKLSAKP